MSQAPEVQQDAKGYFYVTPEGVTMRVTADGTGWEAEAAPAPAPPAPAPVMPQPVMPQPIMQQPAAVAPQQVMPTAAPQPVMQQPVQPVMQPQPQPVMQSPVDALNAAMNQQAPATGAGSASDVNLLMGDMSDVNDNSFAVIPAGTTVNCIVGEIELTEAKSDGKPMMKLVFEVVDPAYKGKKIWDYIKLDESTRWKFKSLCRATGLLSPDESKFTGGSIFDFKGRRLAIKVKVEEYNGSDSNKVSGAYEMYSDGQVAVAPVPGVAPTWPQA